MKAHAVKDEYKFGRFQGRSGRDTSSEKSAPNSRRGSLTSLVPPVEPRRPGSGSRHTPSFAPHEFAPPKSPVIGLAQLIQVVQI